MIRKHEGAKYRTPEWMSAYGNLVTLLLCLFIMLFAASSVDTAKFRDMANSVVNNPISADSRIAASDSINELLSAGIIYMSGKARTENVTGNQATYETTQEELRLMALNLETCFAENDMLDKINVELNKDSIELIFSDDVLFDRDRATFKPDAVDALDILVAELLKYSETDIEVIGHTDTEPINTPQYQSNWFLSAAKAVAVGSYFIEDKGLDPSRFTCLGRGEYMPVAPNDTPENKAKNRRMEFKIKSRYYSGSRKYENHKGES